MKKILFVASVVKTHIMQFHVPYLRMLKDMGWSTAVAAGNDYDDPAECHIPYCDRFYPIDFARNPFHPRNLNAYRALQRVIAEGHYDLIHCHTPVGAALTRLAARRARKAGTRVLYTAHGFHFFRGASPLHWMLYYPAERALAAWTDVLITINREDYAAAQRFPAGRIEYVPGVGIDWTRFAAARQDRGALRAALGLDADDFVLLSVGELIPRKNHALVLQALDVLQRQGQLSRVRYVISGQGASERQLKAQAAALGLMDRVRFTGYRNDVERLYGAADAFVFPSRQEGLPVALMEAMAAGLPCLCSDVRGNRDLIQTEQTGLIVPSAPQAVARAILRLRDDPALCEALGSAAQAAARAYDLPAALDRMRAIYLSASDGNGFGGMA